MKCAWLITWEWFGSHAKKSKKIVSILNYRRSSRQIKHFVERLYVDSEYSLTERLSYAKSSKNNPYPAAMSQRGHITCGHNPFLLGRLVKNLKVRIDSKGREHLQWEEVTPIDPKL